MNEEEINPPEDAELRLQLSRMPRRNAPSSLMKKLRRDFVAPPWRERLRAYFTWPATAGALTAAAFFVALWVSYQYNAKDEIELAPLLAAHTHTEAESIIPNSDMTASDFSAQLASYYGND